MWLKANKVTRYFLLPYTLQRTLNSMTDCLVTIDQANQVFSIISTRFESQELFADPVAPFDLSDS
jgi:hypothetical protein